LPENSVFFDNIIAQRSLLLSEEDALEGATTVSLETQAEMGELDVLSYIEDNFPEFMRTLRYLPSEDQELLLSYYLLAKTQTTLAVLYRTTQTLISTRIRMAMQRIGTYMLLGPPTVELMRGILTETGLENLLSTPLSGIVALYAETRSFQRVAELAGLHRPDIRRVMSQAARQLNESTIAHHKALGAYIAGLIDKASATGQGFSKRKLMKQGDIYVKDPEVLGKFVIDVAHPDFTHVFVSRANR
jgi:hypothetical protein